VNAHPPPVGAYTMFLGAAAEAAINEVTPAVEQTAGSDQASGAAEAGAWLTHTVSWPGSCPPNRDSGGAFDSLGMGND